MLTDRARPGTLGTERTDVGERQDVVTRRSRTEITGYPNHHQVSDLGFVQFDNGYDPALLSVIAAKAQRIKATHARKRQLNLNYVRDAVSLIPEIRELVEAPGRRERLSELAGTELEPYPIPVIATILTFTGHAPADGAIGWHADGVPVTELIPIVIENASGGELELYQGLCDEGLAQVHAGWTIPEERILRVEHAVGRSVLAQLMRVMHRVRPMGSGFRITLNLNFRSREKPFLDDNSMCYLGADNPDFAWEAGYVDDVKRRQLPAYLAGLERGRDADA